MMKHAPKKKVLFLITKSNFGGAQRYVYDLASHLPKDSYDVVVAYGGTGMPGSSAGKLEALLREAHIRTLFVKNFAYDVFFIKEFMALFELVHIFHKEKPDIVHLNSSKAGGIGALAARIVGVKKIIYTSHGWAFNEPVSWLSKTFRWLASLATVILSHHIIAVSHFEARHTPLGFKATVIHNGVMDFIPLPQKEARAHIEKQFGISPDSFLIGAIAELHPSKSLDNLIHAATRFTEGHILIIGEGRARNELERLIKKHNLIHRIHLVGFVEDARSLLSGFDIFVLPSRKEALGYVILEAGIAKLPVVSSRVGGIPEIIEHGISGELVPINDSVVLAEKIQYMYDNPPVRKKYGEQLHETVQRSFTIAHMVKRTLEVYGS